MKKYNWSKFDKMTELSECGDEKSRQIKCHYCSLIQYELQKMNEEQLLKCLILVKNTTDDVKKPDVVKQKNEVLFNPQNKCVTEYNKPSDHAIRDGASLIQYITSRGFTGGYGVVVIDGNSTDPLRISRYVCFCLPDVFDVMVEINDKHYFFSIREVGNSKIPTIKFTRFNELISELGKLDKYKK